MAIYVQGREGQERLALFGNDHVRQALSDSPALRSLWTEYSNDRIPCFKTLDMNSATRGYQPQHLSLQEYLAARMFRDKVLLQHKFVPTSFFPSSYKLAQWFSGGKAVQAAVLSDKCCVNFFRVLAGEACNVQQSPRLTIDVWSTGFPGAREAMFANGGACMHIVTTSCD